MDMIFIEWILGKTNVFFCILDIGNPKHGVLQNITHHITITKYGPPIYIWQILYSKPTLNIFKGVFILYVCTK